VAGGSKNSSLGNYQSYARTDPATGRNERHLGFDFQPILRIQKSLERIVKQPKIAKRPNIHNSLL